MKVYRVFEPKEPTIEEAKANLQLQKEMKFFTKKWIEMEQEIRMEIIHQVFETPTKEQMMEFTFVDGEYGKVLVNNIWIGHIKREYATLENNFTPSVKFIPFNS